MAIHTLHLVRCLVDVISFLHPSHLTWRISAALEGCELNWNDPFYIPAPYLIEVLLDMF